MPIPFVLCSLAKSTSNSHPSTKRWQKRYRDSHKVWKVQILSTSNGQTSRSAFYV